jgi:hypothetical protein
LENEEEERFYSKEIFEERAFLAAISRLKTSTKYYQSILKSILHTYQVMSFMHEGLQS